MPYRNIGKSGLDAAMMAAPLLDVNALDLRHVIVIGQLFNGEPILSASTHTKCTIAMLIVSLDNMMQEFTDRVVFEDAHSCLRQLVRILSL